MSNLLTRLTKKKKIDNVKSVNPFNKKKKGKQMSANKLIKKLKTENQDFNFYPTTNEILDCLYNHIDKNRSESDSRLISILDIGAGECKLLNRFKELSGEKNENKEAYLKNHIEIEKYMAIEKSSILIERMPEEAFIVGTDFYENTILDKKADLIFSNPPYDSYSAFSEKIILEANAKVIYLVIPRRFGRDKRIANALKARQAKVKIIENFDFLNAEDRKANAHVSLVEISLNKRRFRGRLRKCPDLRVDPFEKWFNEAFSINSDKDTEIEKEEACFAKERNEIVKGEDLVARLVGLYNKELEHLVSNYKSVMSLDNAILKELGVETTKLLDAFKVRIKNLKILYWNEIFKNLEEIKSRLTRKSRNTMLDELNDNTNIDFTASNVRSVVIWVIKNANKYFDVQIEELYDELTDVENLNMYKSNRHWAKDTWKYCSKWDFKQDIKKHKIKYSLEYRIVKEFSYGNNDVRSKLPDEQKRIQEDLCSVARNLGFTIEDNQTNQGKVNYGNKEFVYTTRDKKVGLKRGQKTNLGKIEEVFYLEDQKEFQYKINGEFYHWKAVKSDDEILFTVKNYKKGTVHFQMNTELMKKINLAVSKQKGWIKSPKEASEEFDISEREAVEFWNTNQGLVGSVVTNLLGL